MTTNIETTHGTVETRVHGNGAHAVLLLHPLALSGAAWDTWGPALAAKGHRVVAPTLPAISSQPVTIREMAAQAAALLDTLEIESASIVGLSMGGCVALQIALDHPTLVEALVLADTTSDYGPDSAQQWEERALTAATSSREGLLEFQTARWFSDGFAAENPEEYERLLEIFKHTPASVHAASCRALGAFSCTEALDEIDRPTLVLVGSDDFATPPEMAAVTASGIRGARCEVLPHVRHFSLFESELARRTVEQFLSA